MGTWLVPWKDRAVMAWPKQILPQPQTLQDKREKQQRQPASRSVQLHLASQTPWLCIILMV